MFITKPELQKPHCEPLYWASVVEMGLNWPAEGLRWGQYYRDIPPRAYLDSASMVVTDEPSTLHSGRRHCRSQQHAEHGQHGKPS